MRRIASAMFAQLSHAHCKFKQYKNCKDVNQSTQRVKHYLTEMNPGKL